MLQLKETNLQFSPNYLLEGSSISSFCSLYHYRWWINGNIKLHYLSKIHFSETLDHSIPNIIFKDGNNVFHQDIITPRFLALSIYSSSLVSIWLFVAFILITKLISMQTLKLLCFLEILTGGNLDMLGVELIYS